VALYFDDLHLAAEGLQRSKQAAENLIASGFQPGERMGIFTDSGTVTVDFTSDTAVLLAALPRIKSHNDPADLVMTICPDLTPYTAFLIAEHLELQVRERAVAEVMSTRCDGVSHNVAEGKVQDYAESLWENSPTPVHVRAGRSQACCRTPCQTGREPHSHSAVGGVYRRRAHEEREKRDLRRRIARSRG